MTDYIVTRWYRAPEVILSEFGYSKAIDIWSVGCVLAELMGRKALFIGKDSLDQIKRIVQIMGTPTENDLDWLPRDCPARTLLHRLPQCEKTEWNEMYPLASANAIETLNSLLCLHPKKRVTAREAMQMRYFCRYHRPDDLLMVADQPVDWRFDNFEPTRRVLQNHIYAECSRFHPEILRRDAEFLSSRGIDQLLRDCPSSTCRVVG